MPISQWTLKSSTSNLFLISPTCPGKLDHQILHHLTHNAHRLLGSFVEQRPTRWVPLEVLKVSFHVECCGLSVAMFSPIQGRKPSTEQKIRHSLRVVPYFVPRKYHRNGVSNFLVNFSCCADVNLFSIACHQFKPRVLWSAAFDIFSKTFYLFSICTRISNWTSTCFQLLQQNPKSSNSSSEHAIGVYC